MIPGVILHMPNRQRRLSVRAAEVWALRSPEQDRLMVERLYAAWQRAEVRSREVPPGSPEYQERLAGVDQIWAEYEQALAAAVGRGSLKRA